MNDLLDYFTNYCVNNQLISPDDEVWFRYGLEKRLCTFIILVPFAIVAVLISGFWTAMFFINSFFYLRTQTNGYHAKTYWGCFLGSLLLELFFLMVIEPMLDAIGVLVLLIAAVMLVFALAPYNHPMMNLDNHEYNACKIAARIRSMRLAASCVIFHFLKIPEAANGISLGCAMTSTLLVLAIIDERRKRYETVEDHSKQGTSINI